MNAEPRTALVLSGGGARAAYQVGVLRGLLDLGVLSSGVDILVGSSAGAINAGALAARAEDIDKAVGTLEGVWSNLRIDQVFRTDIRSLGTIGARWAWDLTFGGAFGHVTPKSLLDTSPLRKLLKEMVPIRRIGANLGQGKLQALAVAATDLGTAEGVIFAQSRHQVSFAQRHGWRMQQVEIGIDHLLASSAIPIFFPSVVIDGRHLGDGCIRNTTPLRPAITLGADRIVAIGVRGPRQPVKPSRAASPSIAQIAGVLLDAVMMDSIESDVEHAEHVNTSVAACANVCGNPFRRINVLWIQPSASLAAIAAELQDRIPNSLRYLMRGLGTDEALIELASYLLFDGAFCTRLIDLGRADVAASQDRVERFFSTTGAAPSRGEAQRLAAEA